MGEEMRGIGGGIGDGEYRGVGGMGSVAGR